MKISKLLNIFGMTAAFAALYIILVQVYYDLTYNRTIPDSERVYLMTLPMFNDGRLQSFLPRPHAEMLLAENPNLEVYGVAKLDDVNKIDVVVGEGLEAKTHSVTFAQMTSGALETFGFKSIIGSFEEMGEGGYVAISETAAKRLGVSVDSILQLESWGKMNYFVVRAIYEDLPMASDLQNIEVIRCNQLETQDLYDANNWSYNYYIKLRSADDRVLFEEMVTAKYKELAGEELKRFRGVQYNDSSVYKQLNQMEEFLNSEKLYCQLIPISELYFCKVLNWTVGQETGNQTTTITLLIVAVLIVIITLINYVNFFFAQVPMRIRSVNTRKILGSSRMALVGRFLLESVILVFISLVLSIVVVKLFQSSEYANFISCELDFVKNWVVLVFTIGIAILMTILAGIYPAMYATSFPPALAIKGSFGMSQKGKSLRYTLIGLQFVISIAFIICVIFFKQQHSYMMNFDMGFDKECLITANIPLNSLDQRDAFSSELLNNPNIKAVAWSQDRMVAESRMEWGRWHHGEQMSLSVMPVSWNFLQVMGIEVVEGRDFLPSDEKGDGAIILNEYAKKKYNLNLEEKIEWNGKPFPATGFCRDFHFEPLHYESEAFAFYIYDSEIQNRYFITPHLTVRTIENADIKAVFDAIRATTDKILPDYGGQKVKINFFDEELGENYEKEQQLTTTISLFTLLAIIISLMGVLGLVIFETQYRRKEIGIRRVNGATVREILLMFNRKFMIIVAICFLIAAPISYLITDYYYSTFAYRAPIAVWVFVVALLAVLFVTTLVVTLATFRTASANPVESLRTE